MGVRVNKKITLQEKVVMLCPICKCKFPEGTQYCIQCGAKLKKQTAKVYANVTANGVTSVSIRTPNATINSKGKVTIPLGNGISYITDIVKKNK